MLRLTVRAPLALGLLLVLGAAPARAARAKSEKPAPPGKTVFLIARPELNDPIFEESVVLLLPSAIVQADTEEGTPVIGLMLNRPALITLNEVFPGDKALKDRSITAYFGGPVDPHFPSIVFRDSKAPRQALLLFGDVYLSFDPAFIKSLLKKPGKISDLHLFLGRSQWSADQLQDEMLKGAWYSLEAETNLIFSANPQYLWRNLSARADPVPVVKFQLPDSPVASFANLTNGHGTQRVAPVSLMP